MALFPEQILDEILSRIDLVGLISDYLELKKAGKDYKGLCPFHSEKTPSFMVSPDKNIYHCFGCAEGGNAFTFTMKMEGLNFPEAVKNLAGRCGVDLSLYEKRDPGEQESPTEIFYKINRYALWFFQETLKSSLGKDASTYLQKRKLTEATISEFKIGYASKDWDSLVQFFKSKNVPLEAAAKLGLIKKRKEGDGFYDFFRDRIMFPIMDPDGRILGFGGRRLNDGGDEPKYINSPESPIYHKGQSIFGLYQTKKHIRHSGEVVLVEGYMDLISLYQAGITYLAAPLGTAITNLQIRYLKKLASRFLLLHDSDEAGKNATQRALDCFLAEGIHPYFVSLSQGKDPDEAISLLGVSGVKHEIKMAKPAIEQLLIEAYSTQGLSPSQKIERSAPLKALIDRLPQVLERKGYLARLEQILGIHSSFSRPEYRVSFKGGAKVSNLPQKISLERILVQLYVHYPTRLASIFDKDLIEDFEDDVFKNLMHALCEQMEKAGGLRLDQLVLPNGSFEEKIISELAFGSPIELESQVDQLVNDCMMQLRKNHFKKELKEITTAIHVAEMKNNQEEISSLIMQKKNLVSKNPR